MIVFERHASSQSTSTADVNVTSLDAVSVDRAARSSVSIKAGVISGEKPRPN